MTKGGARTRSGPPPDPDALRRDRDKTGLRHLPAAGRAGDPPAWPLTRPSKRELELWTLEWRHPQAIVWEENGQSIEVAMYVRSLAAAEKPKATVASRTLVRQQMDALGLTEPGLQRNRWVIDDASDAAAPVRTDDGNDRSSAKARFRAIAGGAA